ncbi:Protein ALP1-like [Holothuria leucospilota]|uniref:Putative nuclease HARBI1 n=1 Tax=Holothuria leucospilota TaxID=206669 RepID=A0A9Q1CE23_HOLLE|nr:Protein ALP1-like [Holothuria leucospilota]
MAAHLLYIHNARALQRERVFRDRMNPLDSYSDKRMHKYYRFTRNGVMRVIDILEPLLQNQTERSHAIHPHVQVFVALRFFATWDFYSSTSVQHGISESSVCRIVQRVTNAIVGLEDYYIKWPTTQQKMSENQLGFFAKSNFPGVVGAIDCTHVPLDSSPLGRNEYVYVNRKGVHTLNVQLVCDADFHITNVVARWPGSCHDSRILQNSAIWDLFEQGRLSGILLGDSGYPQRKWLMTPFRNPDTPGRRAYSE